MSNVERRKTDYWSIILACVRRRHFGSVNYLLFSKILPKKYFESIYAIIPSKSESYLK